MYLSYESLITSAHTPPCIITYMCMNVQLQRYMYTAVRYMYTAVRYSDSLQLTTYRYRTCTVNRNSKPCPEN